jgi:hypothetical protein
MAYTIVQIETLMLRRTKAILTEVAFETDATGTNPDMADPISFALLLMDIEPGDITVPVDADLITLTADNITQLLDLTEYRLLLNIAQNFDDVDVRIGHRQEEFSQLANRIIMRTDRLRTHLRTSYGYGRGDLEGGVIDLDFDSSGDDTIAETAGV